MKFLFGFIFLFFSSLVSFVFLNGVLWAADTRPFYTLSEQWEKRGQSGQSKPEAIDDVISKAVKASNEARGSSSFPTSPAVKKDLTQILSSGAVVSVDYDQSLFITTESPIVKFISTNENIVTMETVASDKLHLIGSQVGNTFVHIWDSVGRHTFSVTVKQPAIVPSSEFTKKREASEKTRPFRGYYNNSRGASYNAEKYREARRSSVDFNQRIAFDGDTPYGGLSGHAQIQKNVGKNQLTDIQTAITDGKIGHLDNFNIALGDSSVKPQLQVFPQARIRGVAFEHWEDEKKNEFLGFYGREQTSIIGTLTPGVVSKRTIDSYLSGGVLNYQLRDGLRLRSGVFGGAGQGRSDSLNRIGFGNNARIKIGDVNNLELNVDYDREHFAQRYSLSTTLDKVSLRNEFRDVSKKFFTLVGAPSSQGEVGYSNQITIRPFKKLSLSGKYDLFRDRLIVNPEDPDRPNYHTTIEMAYIPDDASHLTLLFQDLDDEGQLNPTKNRLYEVYYNRRLNFWGRRFSWFARFQNRSNQTINNPTFDYQRDQISLGLYGPLFWGINFSVQKEISSLKNINLDESSYPHLTSYNLDYAKQIEGTPFDVTASFRYRDEEETELQNSFMSGEDSLEVSGGLKYRASSDFEIFLNGSFTNYRPESLAGTSPRVEYQFVTGVNYIYDSEWRWTTIGAFNGYVFKDLNGNGIREPEESGIEGMVVKINDGREAVTDENGYYELKSVLGNNVLLELDSSKFPTGYSPTVSSKVNLKNIQNQLQEVSFGLTPRSGLTGIVFNDLNGDGKYSMSEPGISKIKIGLEDGKKARTNSLGVYLFSDMTAGDHVASLAIDTLPEGYLPLNVPTKKIKLTEGIRYELHFPLRAVRIISGRVFEDNNKNKKMDINEHVLPGVKVVLGNTEIVTDEGGWYLFNDVNPGLYELFVLPESLPQGKVSNFRETLEITANPVTDGKKDIGVEAVASEDSKEQIRYT